MTEFLPIWIFWLILNTKKWQNGQKIAKLETLEKSCCQLSFWMNIFNIYCTNFWKTALTVFYENTVDFECKKSFFCLDSFPQKFKISNARKNGAAKKFFNFFSIFFKNRGCEKFLKNQQNHKNIFGQKHGDLGTQNAKTVLELQRA